MERQVSLVLGCTTNPSGFNLQGPRCASPRNSHAQEKAGTKGCSSNEEQGADGNKVTSKLSRGFQFRQTRFASEHRHGAHIKSSQLPHPLVSSNPSQPWTPPGVGHPQLLWVPCATTLTVKNFIPMSNLNFHSERGKNCPLPKKILH